MIRKRTKKGLGFENLESRTVLAGDISVSFSGDTLTLTGDELGNVVLIDFDQVSGKVSVTGGATTLNNDVAPQPLLFAGVKNIVANLNDGNDAIIVNNVSLNNLIINTGNGEDAVILGPDTDIDITSQEGVDAAVAAGSVGISGLLLIDTGADNDYVQAQRVFGLSNWSVTLGSGDDYFYTYWDSCQNLDVFGNAGNDTINLGYIVANGVTTVIGGDDIDFVNVYISNFKEDANFYGNAGIDTIAADTNYFEKNVLINTGAGDDSFLFASNVVGNYVTIFTEGGNDQGLIGKHVDYSTGGNIANGLTLDTGSEDDQVLIGNNAFNNFYANFGSGNDDLEMDEYIYIKNKGVADGGAGTNYFYKFGNPNLFIYNFIIHEIEEQEMEEVNEA